MARENYVYETDDLAFHLVTLMSSVDEQRRFKDMHDARNSPASALRDHGYVRIEDIQMWKIGDGKQKAQQYVIKFDRKIMRSGQPVPDHGDPVTVEVSFAFHPEYPMSLPDRRLNPTGFQAIDYHVTADGKRTQ